MKSASILIIGEDKEFDSLLALYLRSFEFEALIATSREEGIEQLKSRKPDLVALDVSSPKHDGLQLCQDIRNFSEIPIVILTAHGETTDRIAGLQMGADDYLPKPFDPRELVARIQSILRRTSQRPEPMSPRAIRSGEVILDFRKAHVTLNGQVLSLTSTEFKVLDLLFRSAGETISREKIAHAVQGITWDTCDRTIDVLISRIRQKLRDDKRNPRFIKTMWGEGYRFIGSIAFE